MKYTSAKNPPPPKVSAKRSAAKAVSWRIIGTFDTLVLSWLVITYLGPLLISPAIGTGFRDIRPVLHAAAFAFAGGALGCWAGAIVSTMINCPPQHGQGRARTRGGASASLMVLPLSCSL
jgi:hypothetical protein